MPVTEFPPVFFKRNAFKHESEVRAVVAPEYRVEKAEEELRPPGVEYPIDPERLIKAVVVSPYSPGWLPDIVESVLEKYEINAAVEKSVLERRPPGEGAILTVRKLKAYFAFHEDERPVRVWTTSRTYALEAACEHWQRSPDDEQIDVWTAAECDAGHHVRPNEYERIVSRHNTDHQNSLDLERT